MSSETERFEGGCLCGAVRFVRDRPAERGRVVPLLELPQAQRRTGFGLCAVRPRRLCGHQGEIAKFDSTPGRTRRGFCSRCGSTLTCESIRRPGDTHFHIGAFDRSAELHPTRHIFPEEQLPWLHLGPDQPARSG